MIEELDVIDWNAFVEYEKYHNEYMIDYQSRLEDIPIEEIEKYFRKKLRELSEI